MWLIQHKCHPEQSEVGNYAMMAVDDPHLGPLTRAFCPDCREQLLFVGQDVFTEANPVQKAIDGLVARDPGFMIARSDISD